MRSFYDSIFFNVPPLRFPEFSGEWTKCRLGELAIKVGSGTTPKGGVNVYKSTGHYFIRSQNVGNGVLLLNDIVYIDEKTHQRQISTELKKDDVLLNITGASIGRCAIATSQIQGGNVNQHVCIIRLKETVTPLYICYFLLSHRGQKQIDSFQAGGNRQGLNFEQIKSFSLFLPMRDEQDKISRLLFLLSDRIATQNKIIEKLETLIKAIGNKCLFGHGRNVRLGDILIERTEKSTINDQYEILSSTIKGIFSQRDYFSKDIASENNIGYKILHKGDIVLSPQNLWMGNINYNDKFDFGIVSPSYKVFAISKEFDCLYVAFLLKTHRSLYSYRSISEQGASIVRRNLNMDAFLELTFKIPPFVAQRQIGQALSKLSDKIEMERDCLNMLKAQKQYLLSHLFI